MSCSKHPLRVVSSINVSLTTVVVVVVVVVVNVVVFVIDGLTWSFVSHGQYFGPEMTSDLPWYTFSIG